MRYVAIAAFAGMFWMSVATLRLIIHADRQGDCPTRAAPPTVLAYPVVPSLAGVPMKSQADWDREPVRCGDSGCHHSFELSTVDPF